MSVSLIDLDGNILSPKPVGIVDSGADSCTFPVDWAPRIGIDVTNDCLKYRGGTAGGPTDQFLYEPGIDATFLGKKLHLGATFSPGCGFVLLGRLDFFRHCSEVRFDQIRQEFHLKLVTDWEAAGKAVDAALAKQADAIKAQIAYEQAQATAASAS